MSRGWWCFRQPGDALVDCPVCLAEKGRPCARNPVRPTTGTSAPANAPRLAPGSVHFGRRLRRLLLTALAASTSRLGGSVNERQEVETEALRLLAAEARQRR